MPAQRDHALQAFIDGAIDQGSPIRRHDFSQMTIGVGGYAENLRPALPPALNAIIT